MNDIVKEATEQSRGRKGMKITIGWALGEICDTYNKKSYIVCDILDDKEPNGIIETLTEVNSQYIIFIWPEWGRWPQDYQYLLRYWYHTLSLWSSVLRMETAAIIAGWKGVNETKWDI
jgi:16S rRNA U1498 N3-methylase RsmE